jgi:hypothetical protein
MLKYDTAVGIYDLQIFLSATQSSQHGLSRAILAVLHLHTRRHYGNLITLIFDVQILTFANRSILPTMNICNDIYLQV